MAIPGFVLWAFTVWAAGFLLLDATPARSLPVREKVAVAFVVGAAALPLLFFLLNWATSWPIINEGIIGDIFAGAVVLAEIALLARLARGRFAARRTRLRLPRPRTAQSTVLTVFLLGSLAVFYYWLWRGLRAPIFGWDEYSFWLYAAKALLVHGGSDSAMAHDAYASYPLGFPYLVAWYYRLTGGISIARAKWVTPTVTSAFFWSLYIVLRRFRVRPVLALLGVCLAAWGSQMILWYNLIAYGEMTYVCVYVLSLLYAASWLENRESAQRGADLFMFALLLGLSAFIRVDGLYVAIMTLILFAMTGGFRRMRKEGGPLALAAFVLVFPTVCWEVFKWAHHIHAGWTSRITVAELGVRLQPAFLWHVVTAVWLTMTDFRVYPIILLLFFITAIAAIAKRRAILFLVLTAYAQIVYLLTAYLSVFSVFEALHASSLDRYLLRIDPIIAAVFIIWLGASHKGTCDNPNSDSGYSAVVAAEENRSHFCLPRHEHDAKQNDDNAKPAHGRYLFVKHGDRANQGEDV